MLGTRYAVDSTAPRACLRAMTTRQATGQRASLPLSVVVGWLCLVWAVVTVPVVRESAVRPLVVVPTTLVLPGYAVAAAAFGPGDDALLSAPVERFVVSVALSVAVAIGVGVSLAVSVGVSAVGALAGLTAVTLCGTLLAERRRESETRAVSSRLRTHFARRSLPSLSTARELPRPAAIPDAIRSVVGRDRDGSGVTLAVVGLVVLCGLAGTGTAAYLLAVHETPGHTEFSVAPVDAPATVASERTATGSLDAPFERGDALRIRLHSERPDSADYEVVALAQRAETGDGLTVRESQTLDRFAVELSPGETWQQRHRPEVPFSNGSVRVVYRLFRGDSAKPVATIHRWVGDTDTATGGTAETEPDSSRNSTAGGDPS